MNNKKPKVYLRTIVSAPNEIKYIKLHLSESKGYVDYVIVCEFNRSHTGEKRDFIFHKYLEDDTFSEEEKERIIYIPGRVDTKVKYSKDDSKILHKNEKLFRGWFARQIRFGLNDIIIAVDADEIIFRRGYSKILPLFDDVSENPIVQLKLYQFFYRPNYLWEDKIILAPTICRYKKHLFHYPAQWRNEGKVYDEVVGCHFSWFLTVEEMIKKLNTYAHAADYSHLSKESILRDAVENKKYPFDTSVDFNIREVNYYDNPEYYPETYGMYVEQFSYLK